MFARLVFLHTHNKHSRFRDPADAIEFHVVGKKGGRESAKRGGKGAEANVCHRFRPISGDCLHSWSDHPVGVN